MINYNNKIRIFGYKKPAMRRSNTVSKIQNILWQSSISFFIVTLKPEENNTLIFKEDILKKKFSHFYFIWIFFFSFLLIELMVHLSKFFQKASSNDKALNFTCSLVDLGNSCIPVMSFCRHIRDVTHSSKNLDCLERMKNG